MWATQSYRPSEKRQKAHVSLDKHIQKARQDFALKRAEVPALRARARALREEAAPMTERHQTRPKQDRLIEAEELEAEADTRASLERENEYERMVAPYLQAYQQRVEVDPVADGSPRNITVPGCGKKRETIDTYVQQYDATANRQTAVVNEYLMETTDEPPKLALHTRDDCPLCGEKLMLFTTKSIMTCPKCGYGVAYLDATMSSMSYSDDVEFSSFSYKRINHFNEWLQQVQAKETFEISADVLHMVMAELKRQRIHDLSLITPKKVREVLKVLKLRKAYEHVAQITSRLTGVRPMRIPPEAEEMCRLMFIAVQPAFDRHCPKDRKNFLSYSYCLYKFFQLLGYEQFLDSFTLLKGRDKLARQDEIFKKICADLDWEFVPSI